MSNFVNTTDLLGDDAVCDGIIDRSLPEYADNRITSIGEYTFYNCANMTKIDLPNVISVGVFSFYGCSAVQTINLPVAVEIGNYAFYNEYAMESIYIPVATSLGKSSIRYCTSLPKIDLPKAMFIDTYAFYNCSALTAVILRSPTMCELASTNVFGNMPISQGTGYIYVPKALVSTYIAGTNWSAFADQIRAIEDYPDITGG